MTFGNDVSAIGDLSRSGQGSLVPSMAETQGWSSDPRSCAPKRAALAVSMLPANEPLASVSYVSSGNLLVIGGDERALACAERLAAWPDSPARRST